MSVHTIHIVPNFHYDVAYLKPYADYLPNCFKIIDEALQMAEDHPEYRFLIEQVILLQEYWNRFPEKRDRLKKQVREGRIAVSPGMYVMPDMNLLMGESFFLQAKLGKEWLKENLDYDPKTCWIADCWGHPSQVPQILTQCGYKYYVCWRTMRPDVMRNDFIWQGLDGTRIKTHWLPFNYSGLRFPDTNAVVNAGDQNLFGVTVDALQTMFDGFQKYGESNSVLVCNGGDMMFPQPSAPEIVRAVNEAGTTLSVRFSTPEEYLDQVDWDSQPVVDGEFNSSLQGTFTTNIRIKQTDRMLCRRMMALESLSVMTQSQPRDYDEIWALILKQQFHDIICGTICDQALTDFFAEAEAAAGMIESEVSALSQPDAKPYLFNPLSFERNVIVEHEGSKFSATLPAYGFADLAECQKMPALDSSKLPAVFENEFYRAEIDENGYISSLKTKPGEVELVRSEPCSFGALGMQVDNGDSWLNFEGPIMGGSMASSLVQDNPDPFDRCDRNGIINSGTWTASVNSAKACVSENVLEIEQEGQMVFWRLNIRFVTKTRMYRKSPRIDYETTLFPMGKNYRIRAAFPTTIKDGRIRHEVGFGIQKRSGHEHPAQDWIDYSDGGVGVALINEGNPANNVDDGVMMLTLFRSAAMEYKTESVLSYSEGVPHVFRYAIFPHSDVPDHRIIQESRDFVNKPMVCRIDPSNLPNDGWSIDAPNVFSTALRWSRGRIFMRIYEAVGKETTVKINLPASVTAYAPTDGLENPIGDFRPCSGSIQVHLHPFQITGFLFAID